MNQRDLKLIIAQQIVLLKRIEKLEKGHKNAIHIAPISSYQQELEEEAMKIIDQIQI